jgi:SNF2 family DNA or RNA helicase
MLLTGTPLSNNLRELWSLLNFIMPDIFDDRDLFDQIEEGINTYSEDQNQKFEKQCNIAKKFHGLIRPFIMRRTKKEIDLGLPPKT